MSQVKSENILSQAERGRRMGYGNGSGRVGAGTHDLAAANYFDRADIVLSDDPQRLAESRAERRKLISAVTEIGIRPDQTQATLSVLREYERGPAGKTKAPLDEAAKTALAARTKEELRRELGSEEAAQKLISRVVQTVGVPMAAKVPSLATRFNETGAALDPRFFLAFRDDPEPPKAA